MKELIKDLYPELGKDQDLLDLIQEHGLLKSLKQSDIIMDYGSYIRSVPLILSGLLKVMREGTDQNERLLYFLSPGSSCAASFSCCLVRKKSEIRVICEEDASLVLISLELADQWMGRFTSWRNFVLNTYDSRIFALIDTVDKLAFTKLDEQLLDYLEERSSYSQDGILRETHQQIANDLNVSREAISRLLKKLETTGVVELGRNQIRLNSTG